MTDPGTSPGFIEIAFDANNHLGETPMWSVDDKALWWVNCEQPPEIHRWQPATGIHRTWDMPDRVGGFVHKPDGNLLIVLADGLYDFDISSERLTLRVKSGLPTEVKLHECHCDRQGRLWVGAYDHAFPEDGNSRRGNWYRLDGNELTCVIEGIQVANGLAFSPDGTRVYFADSPTQRVEVYDYDTANGSISNGRPFFQLGEGEGFVDGATVDEEGGYWAANVTAGRLRRYLPDGTLDRIVDLPFTNPTKPAFGGARLRTLYVTSTQLDLPALKEPTASNGPVYSLDVGFAGVPEVPFAG